MRRYRLKSEVEANIAQFHLSTPDISHLLLLWVMDIDLPQNTCKYPMSRLSILIFAPISYSDSSAARSADRAWYTLLKGAYTTSM